MEKRYGVLRLIATLYKILGILVGIATLLGAIGFCALTAAGSQSFNNFGDGRPQAAGIVGGALGGLVVLLVGAIYTLTLYAVGDGLSLLLSLEENTRLTATLLQQNLRQLVAPPPSLPPATAPSPAPAEKPALP